MSILNEWMMRKNAACGALIVLFRELRDTLNSKLLMEEKHYLFVSTHLREIRDRAGLVRPDRYPIGSTGPNSFRGPDQRHPGVGVEERLIDYLNELGEIVDYAHHKTELLAAVSAVAAVMEMDLPIISSLDGRSVSHGARRNEFEKHVPRLRAAFEALRLEPSIRIGSPESSYFLDDDAHRKWVQSLQACAAKA